MNESEFETFLTINKTKGVFTMRIRKKTVFIAQTAVIAALYAGLTWLGAPLASGVIQIRFAEALTVLPCFTPTAIPGVAVGCLLANLLLPGTAPWDVVVGTLASLIGACGTYLLRKKPIPALLSPVLANTLTIPFVLSYVYGYEGTIPYFMLTVGIGEVISVLGCGGLLYAALRKYGRSIPFFTGG